MIACAGIAYTPHIVAAELNDERIDKSVEHIKEKAKEASDAVIEVVSTSFDVAQEYTLTARERIRHWVQYLRKLGAIAVGSAALSVANMCHDVADKMDEVCSQAEAQTQPNEERA